MPSDVARRWEAVDVVPGRVWCVLLVVDLAMWGVLVSLAVLLARHLL